MECMAVRVSALMPCIDLAAQTFLQPPASGWRLTHHTAHCSALIVDAFHRSKLSRFYVSLRMYSSLYALIGYVIILTVALISIPMNVYKKITIKIVFLKILFNYNILNYMLDRGSVLISPQMI